MMKYDKYMFVDAETDGLYGRILSIAALVCDSKGNEIETFDHYCSVTEEDIEDPWVKEHVYPILKTGIEEKDEHSLLCSFWNFYKKQSDCAIIGDVTYPVECRVFEKCVRMDLPGRAFEGPFPLMDLSSMLYAKGYDPLTERYDLVADKIMFNQHSAIDDVRMAKEIWKNLIIEKI